MNMEEMDKRIMEVARNAVKEYLEESLRRRGMFLLKRKVDWRADIMKEKWKHSYLKYEIEFLNAPRKREGKFITAPFYTYAR